MEIWAAAVNNSVQAIERQAERAEAAGFDGLFYSDSQNLRLVIPGHLAGGDPAAELSRRLLLDEVLPNIRCGTGGTPLQGGSLSRLSERLAALCAADGEFRLATRYWTGTL